MSRADQERLLRLLTEKQRRDAEASLHTFTRLGWELIEPGREFIDNWHLHAICEHLEAVSRGEIKRLVINVPFRTSKSTFVSVAWPAWTWIKKPSHQWLIGSYAEKLAIRDSLKMRRLIQSKWYQSLWPNHVMLARDQSEKKRFQNTRNGHRIAFGMTGGVMGDGGDTLVIDDPHDRQGANSEAERPAALTTYDEALITRLNDPNTGSIVIIMQRLHQDDLAGHVLKEKGWEHLMLPMEYEPTRHCRTSIFSDPRKEEGELLWPARFNRPTVEALKVRLGSYGASGQLQQRPSPAGGGILQMTKNLKVWPHNKPLPVFDAILQSYDTALTDTTAADDTGCTVWGFFTHREDEVIVRRAMLLDAWNEKLQYPALRKKMMADWKAQYGGDDKDVLNKPRRPDVLLIEEKGSGISIKQDLRLAGIPVQGYNPGRAGKTTRAELTAPMLEAGSFYVLESKSDHKAGEPGKPVKWARKLIEQCEQFPNGENDDLVDTFTQAAIYGHRTGLLELPEVPADPVTERDYHAEKRPPNPYG